MFDLIPWRKKEQPIARLQDEFASLFDRLLSLWPAPFDAQYGFDTLWGLDVEDRDNDNFVGQLVPTLVVLGDGRHWGHWRGPFL